MVIVAELLYQESLLLSQSALNATVFSLFTYPDVCGKFENRAFRQSTHLSLGHFEKFLWKFIDLPR